MASPSGIDYSKFRKKSSEPKKKFTPAVAKKEESNIRDYAAAFFRGVSGFAPGGLIGAAAGGIGEAIGQTIEDREDYNFPAMGVAAGLGAVPFGKAAGLVRGALKGGLMGGVGNVATSLAEGRDIDPLNVTLATGLGAVGGGITGKIDFSKFRPKANIPTLEVKPTVVESVIKPKPITTKAGAERIRSNDPEAGRRIMEEIRAASLASKPIEPAAPQVSLQQPKDSKHKGSWVISLLNIPKAFSSSGDLSFPLRQGIFLMGRKEWWKAWKPMFQALKEGKYKEIDAEITNHPRYIEASDNGLAIADLENIMKREEQFGSDLVGNLPIIKQSERAFTTFANKLRMDLYSNLVDKAERLKIPADRKMIAAYVNSATGRGSMGLTVGGKSKTLEAAAPFLNTTFFSPRLIASRIQLLNPVSYIKMDPFTRREAIRDLATLTLVAGTVLGLAKLNGADVDFDPTSQEFGKIKVGNTRIDVLGGFSQYIRFFSQAIKGMSTDAEGPDPKRFIESKLSPSARLVMELISGKDYFGRDTSIPKSTLNAFSPMITRDIYELWKEDPDLVPLSGLSMFGLGIQTYGETRKRGTPSGIPRIKLNLPKGMQ